MRGTDAGYATWVGKAESLGTGGRRPDNPQKMAKTKQNQKGGSVRNNVNFASVKQQCWG